MLEPNENPSVIAQFLADLVSLVHGVECWVAHFVLPRAVDFSIWDESTLTMTTSGRIPIGRL